MAANAPLLHPRQQELIVLLNRGLGNAEIARQFGIAKTSVERYVFLLKRVLGGDSRFEMVARARALGIVKAPRDGGIKARVLNPRQRAVLRLLREDIRPVDIARALRIPYEGVLASMEQLRLEFPSDTALQLVDTLIDAGLLPGQKPTVARNILTQRECDILDGLNAGLSARVIGRRLGISCSNVGNRVQMLKAKLGVTTIDGLLDEVERRHLHAFSSKRKPRVSRRSVYIEPPTTAAAIHLQDRARTVLELFARWPDKTHREIAEYLGVSKGLIDQCSVQIQRRLGAKSRVSAVERARELGLVSSPRRQVSPKRGCLTARQHRVLRLLARGYSRNRAAPLIGVSSNVVSRDARVVLARLGATSDRSAVDIARRNGLIP